MLSYAFPHRTRVGTCSTMFGKSCNMGAQLPFSVSGALTINTASALPLSNAQLRTR
jgi:hypothetical protein